MKVGIIGCGNIADVHAEQITRIAGAQIVGVCDREALMARQLSERFPVGRYFNDVAELLTTARPDVVHITTPPQSHFALARQCLEAGCHVYVEKPFTVDASEAEALIEIAQATDRQITVGHDDQFTRAARTMRELVRAGYLGGAPVHMESYYCYDLGDQKYALAMLGDARHWVRRLPGRLLQNTISHGISRVAEFLRSDTPTVLAHGFASPFLRSIGEQDILDEVRVIIEDGQSTTAYFTFSSQMRPLLKHFRIYGPKNAIELDHDHQTVVRLRGARYTSYLDKFVPPSMLGRQYLLNAAANVARFLKADLHMKGGMKFLIESFYRSIRDDGPPPIPYREILLTARIMDAIFARLATPPAAVQQP